ncbi:MAG: MBG domain-containing protein, partial [Vicinamibacterales bacterium]
MGTGLGNYTIAYVNGELTILPRAVTITADPKTKVYGDADPALTYQVTAGSLLPGDEFTGALARAAGEAVAGSPYAISQGTVALGANYAITYIGNNLEITPRPLTITANDVSKNFGDEYVFAGTEFTTTPLAFTDAVSSVVLTSAGAPALAALPGPFAIVPSAATGTGLANYAVTYVDGQLTLTAPALTVTKSVSAATADPGGTLVYTINYNNTGNGAANGVVLSDVLPGRTTFASLTGPGTHTVGTVTWNVGTVAPGASGSVSVTVALDAVFPAGTTTVANSAVHSGTNLPGCTTGCTTPPVTTTVTAEPNLTVTKSVSAATALPGGSLVYTINYSNTGDADATNVSLSDVLPARTTFASLTGPGAHAAGTVTWNIGTVAAGGNGSVSVTVTLDPVFPVGTTTLSNAAVYTTPDVPACTAGCTTPPVTTT